MRPPSYYTSPTYSSAYSNTSGDSAARNTSQQLRSTFSSRSSAAYASRTHLPFVAQSSLVAHCIASGGATSARPNYSPSSYTPSSYSARSSYTRPTSSAAFSRRHTDSTSASLLSSNLTSSRYVASPRPSSYLPPATVARSTYRPHAASYYKPIRLRDRPVLTQISRQLNSTASESSASTGQHSNRPTTDSKSSPSRAKLADETSWSNDVARNISRNKYLIKFREVEPRQRESLPPPPQQEEAADELENRARLLGELSDELATSAIRDSTQVAATRQAQEKLRQTETARSAAPAEMRLKSGAQNSVGADNCDSQPTATGDEEKAARGGGGGEPPKASDKKPLRKRNVKLKLKRVATSESGAPTESAAGEKSPAVRTTKLKRVAKSSAKSAIENVACDEKPLGKVERIPLRLKQENDELKSAPESENTSSQASGQVDAPRPQNGAKRIRFREYTYDDFHFLSVLGHGGWGFVVLAELKQHDACFAVKCIKKITIVEDDDFESILIERKVLSLGNEHPFICKLFCTFQTEGYLFFVMEYCAGGDLMFHVQKEGKFSESRCRFYAAEIICAIRFLHNKHIIYRDLKLDNILLDSLGHIRLVDFGMCQCRTYREEMLPSNFCGTPEYISPEIIKGVPYNHSVDWWSFGVLLYEMAVGKMPFRGNDENELLWNVCYEQIHFPMFLSKELASLLKLLLEREPAKRMGMATCKAGDIYEQPFFRALDWRAVEELRVRPPFVPELTSKRDVRNFDSDFTESACELSPVDESVLAKIDQQQFHKFPYTNPNTNIFDAS